MQESQPSSTHLESQLQGDVKNGTRCVVLGLKHAEVFDEQPKIPVIEAPKIPNKPYYRANQRW